MLDWANFSYEFGVSDFSHEEVKRVVEIWLIGFVLLIARAA